MLTSHPRASGSFGSYRRRCSNARLNVSPARSSAKSCPTLRAHTEKTVVKCRSKIAPNISGLRHDARMTAPSVRVKTGPRPSHLKYADARHRFAGISRRFQHGQATPRRPVPLGAFKKTAGTGTPAAGLPCNRGEQIPVLGAATAGGAGRSLGNAIAPAQLWASTVGPSGRARGSARLITVEVVVGTHISVHLARRRFRVRSTRRSSRLLQARCRCECLSTTADAGRRLSSSR